MGPHWTRYRPQEPEACRRHSPGEKRTRDGYDYSSSDASFQSFDDMITGNDPTTYDSLDSFQSFDDVLTDNQGYGWDATTQDGGTIWATGDSSVDSGNFGY